MHKVNYNHNTQVTHTANPVRETILVTAVQSNILMWI